MPEGSPDAPLPTGQQHLYLIFDDWPWGYTIRKLKLPHQPSLRPPEEHKRLPLPCICLAAPRRRPFFFAAVGTNIISAHPRNVFCNSPLPEFILPLVDVRSVGVRFGPGLLYPIKPILITVGDEVFALDIDCFRMLSMKPLCSSSEWSWCDLPQPPFKSMDGNMSFVGEMTLALDNLSNLEGFACHVE